MKSIKYLVVILLLGACKDISHIDKLEKENQLLQNEVDSLRSELNKCDMILESYEGSQLDI